MLDLLPAPFPEALLKCQISVQDEDPGKFMTFRGFSIKTEKALRCPPLQGSFFRKENVQMFVDRATISVKAGDGGNGCCSFRREKFVPKGGPDGGDGGNGGDVILIASANEQNLTPLAYQTRYQAKNGPHGQGADCHGRNAAPVMVKVPVGTIITDADSGELVADLDEEGKSVIAAKGGRGGRGNARFASSVNRAPRRCDPGQPGEERRLQLELKTIADAGLVGFPNAGKSTLISTVSAARPKVAPYPFTTLHPVVGIVEYSDYHRISMADIPGLLEGAHRNVGLGHEFLKHIERTKLLIFVLDMAGVDGRDPVNDLKVLRDELEHYMPGLGKRSGIIVANKMDLEGAEENLARLREELASDPIEIVPLAAGMNELGEFKEKLRTAVEIAKNRYY